MNPCGPVQDWDTGLWRCSVTGEEEYDCEECNAELMDYYDRKRDMEVTG